MTEEIVTKCCERCMSLLSDDATVFACSYRCTFCTACAAALDFICPNCRGQLIEQPAA